MMFNWIKKLFHKCENNLELTGSDIRNGLELKENELVPFRFVVTIEECKICKRIIEKELRRL